MRIHHWEIKDGQGFREIAADIDDFRLWYRLPGSYDVLKSADAFLCAALLPAMARNERLEIEPGLPVSPVLLKNLAVIQDIHHGWNPALKIVPIEAETRPAVSLHPGALSFFSGGVDSMFTFLKRQDELTHVAYIQGFDFRVDDDHFRAPLERNASFVHASGKEIIPVKTNTNAFGYHHNLSMLLTQGSVLASIAHLLGFPRAYISSAYAYSQLVPLGSHPLTDPLWSTEGVEIVHEGAEARRVDKVVRIARDPLALANLQVCAEEVVRNCGHCEKCLRTMIPLSLIGASTPAFPPLPPLAAIRKIRIANEIEMIFFRDNYELAKRRGDAGLRRALGACLRHHDRLRFLRDADRVLLGGLVKRTYRRFVNSTPTSRRITMTPPRD